MLMHAPVVFTLIGLGSTQGGAIARGKHTVGGKGQYPTPLDQKEIFDKLTAVFQDHGVQPLTKSEFIEQVTGSQTPYGSVDFVKLGADGSAELAEDSDMHGAFELEVEVYITDGTEAGSIEISVGQRGTFVSQAFLKEQVDKLVSSVLPAGYRLMTKREFFDTIVAEATGGLAPRLAIPGGEEFAPLA